MAEIGGNARVAPGMGCSHYVREVLQGLARGGCQEMGEPEPGFAGRGSIYMDEQDAQGGGLVTGGP